MSKSVNHVEAAAADFARHTKGGGGWALGLTVAACVEPGNGQGKPHRSHDEGKVSAQEFGRRAGTSADRVLRYLKAWIAASNEGLVNLPEDLTPADWADPDQLPSNVEWSDYYSAAEGVGRNNADPEQRELLTKEAERRGVGTSKVLDVASNPAAVAAALEASPEFREKVAKQMKDTRATDEMSGKIITRTYPDEPVKDIGGSNVVGAVIDADSMLRRLDGVAVEIRQHISKEPAAWTDPKRLERLEHSVDLLVGCTQLIKGVDEDELAAMLGGE